jgi:hypothetical protein
MISSPCKQNGQDCPNRHMGCHANCKAYTEYAELKRAETIHTNKVRTALNSMWDYAGRSGRSIR